LGIYVYFAPGALPWLGRLASGPGDQSSAMLTLMPCALMAIWLARNEAAPRSLQLALLILPPLILVAAYVTLSRTVWVGFIVEFGVFAALLFSRPEFGQTLRLWRARLLAGVVAIAIGGGVALAMVQVQEKRVEESPSAVVAKDPRLEIWTSAAGVIKEHPVLGLGFGRGIARRALVEDLGNTQFWHAHNLILEAAIGSGIPGAALLLLLIGMTAYKGGQLARDKNAEA